MSTTTTIAEGYSSTRPGMNTSLHPNILAQKNTLTLRPMLQRDMPAYFRIMNSAFPTMHSQLFYPKGHSHLDTSWEQQRLQSHLSNDSSWMRHLIVHDSSLPVPESDLLSLCPSDRLASRSEGRILGFSIWKFHPRPLPFLSLSSSQNTISEYAPSSDPIRLNAFYTAIKSCKDSYLPNDTPHVLLHFMGTDPEYNGRGVASMHLKWGLEQADRLGVLTYLEATDEGRGLYEKYGFEKMMRLPFDGREWGCDEELRHVIMIRPVKRTLMIK